MSEIMRLGFGVSGRFEFGVQQFIRSKRGLNERNPDTIKASEPKAPPRSRNLELAKC